jgi:hypothetical protein
MTDVSVDVTPREVRRMAGALGRLANAFDGLDDDTERDAPVSVSGDERVEAKLREFGRNWSLRRDDMAEEMRMLRSLAAAAADAYVGNERLIGTSFDSREGSLSGP